MKLLAYSVLLLVSGLSCMTSAVMVSPEVSPTVTMVSQVQVSDDAGFESEELQDWIPKTQDYEVCVDVLHVRTGPRYGAPVEEYVYRGDVVTVTEYFDGWAMIAPARWVKLKHLC